MWEACIKSSTGGVWILNTLAHLVWANQEPKYTRLYPQRPSAFFSAATILWVLSLCVYSVGYYAPNYAQVAVHHAIIQLCVNAAVNLSNNNLSRHLVDTLMSHWRPPLKCQGDTWKLWLYLEIIVLMQQQGELCKNTWYNVTQFFIFGEISFHFSEALLLTLLKKKVTYLTTTFIFFKFNSNFLWINLNKTTNVWSKKIQENASNLYHYQLPSRIHRQWGTKQNVISK